MHKTLWLDDGIGGLTGWTPATTIKRHAKACEPGHYAVRLDVPLEVERMFDLPSWLCVPAVVDDFGNLVRVPA